MKEFLAKIFPWYYPFGVDVTHLYYNDPTVDPAAIRGEIQDWVDTIGLRYYRIKCDNWVFKFDYPIEVRFKSRDDILAAKLRFG